MPGHDDPSYCRFWIHMQFINIMDDADEDLPKFDNDYFLKLVCPRTGVIIAAHCGKRRHGSQLFQNSWVANIACVNDMVASRKERHRLGPEKAMCI